MAARLSNTTLDQVQVPVQRPAYDRAAASIGVVHFGPGAFFRAHQAAYLDALNARDPRWSIVGVALRSPSVRQALTPQDGLYTLIQLDQEVKARVIGVLREVLTASEQPEGVAARLVSPDVRLVTLTVTEKGYCLDGAGALDLAHPDIRHDLDGPQTPRSVIGWLAHGLAARRDAGLPPFVVLSCDNLSGNGGKLGRAVARFAEASGDPALAAWIEETVAFPNTMVDSITPATDDALRARAAEMLGLEDAWPIQREAFTQWVVEDAFGTDSDIGGALASVGVTVAKAVAPFERAKLRLLNGAHSTLAYVGLLAGLGSVGEAMAEPRLAGFVRAMMLQDIKPTLTPSPDLDVDGYIEAVLGRFRNPAIRHELAQIAWDGSQKLPVRILDTVSDAVTAGAPIDRLAIPVAAWMRFIRLRAKAGVDIVDPLAAELSQLGRDATGEAAEDVAVFLRLPGVFPPSLQTHRPFIEALEQAHAELGGEDPLAALQTARALA